MPAKPNRAAHIPSEAAVHDLVSELAAICSLTQDNEFILASLGILKKFFPAEVIAWGRGTRGKWRILPADLASDADLTEAFAEALDVGAGAAGAWRAMAIPDQSGEVIGVQGADPGESWVQQAIATWSRFASLSRQLRTESRRAARLSAILEIAAQWRQARDMNSLLHDMAEAATRLLDSERASIFLWDRANHLLIGRPALGVEGGELRIPDDRGVVGQVVQTGEPARVDEDDRGQSIDRSVDKELQFTTRSLLCVPLRDSQGRMLGAFEMINKRGGRFSDLDESALLELASHAALALENTKQYEQLLTTHHQMTNEAAASVKLIGTCPQLEALRSSVNRVADTDLSILILGENGTGKEVISQLVHYLSRRRNEMLVAVNCAALPDTLLESELFGHEKGAFTDAHDTRVGKFELASGGTLFLDEIGDMSLSGQAKLLRVLEEKVVVRVGGSTPIHTDARVIAATNQKLAEMVRDKKFREDLYFRLNVVTLELPPLRERGDDILLLAEHFLVDFCRKAGRKPPRFTASAKRRLQSHRWPGNVRELRNLMERLAYLAPGDKIDAGDLAFILHPGEPQGGAWLDMDLGLADATSRFQEQYIRKQIDECGGNMSEAATLLGLHRSNLYRKMRQLGMDTRE
ncbi:MAG: sigma-54-dependent Fis family transcriptional regulator [Planctomycetales bacterium]|nr:sigma-54-dependent Fis family transcriptional regulator [Planctomycetales bacterium]